MAVFFSLFFLLSSRHPLTRVLPFGGCGDRGGKPPPLTMLKLLHEYVRVLEYLSDSCKRVSNNKMASDTCSNIKTAAAAHSKLLADI